jgi:hypothetical protein
VKHKKEKIEEQARKKEQLKRQIRKEKGEKIGRGRMMGKERGKGNTEITAEKREKTKGVRASCVDV